MVGSRATAVKPRRFVQACAAGAVMLSGAQLTAQDGGAPTKASHALQPLQPQAPTGSRIRRDPETMAAERRDKFFDDMAKCVVRREPAKADYFLRRSDDYGMASELGDVTEFLPLSTCVGQVGDPFAIETQARFSPMLLRNWLSEKAYLTRNAVFAPLPADAAPPPERTYYSRTATLLGQAYGVFSDCIVREDAAGADALIRTARNSDEERSAAKALVPAMSACLTEGQTLALDQRIIRGLAAQGLWQRYEAPKPVQYKAKR